MSTLNGDRHFRRSEQLGKLSEALAKAQGEIKNALKDSSNPFFKSRYADLASIRAACSGPLSANGIAVMQFPRTCEKGVEIETLLSHSSGEWVSETLALPVMKEDAQAMGSAITYARRYALAAIVGVAPDDDDGNAAADSASQIGKSKPAPVKPPPPAPPMTEEQKADAWDQLDKLLVKLDWDQPYVLKFLKKTYGKDSVSVLTDDELRNMYKRLTMSLTEVERHRANNEEKTSVPAG